MLQNSTEESAMNSFHNPNQTSHQEVGLQSPLVVFDNQLGHSSLQLHQISSSASSYVDLQYLFGNQDPAMLAPKSNRNRRKSTQGSEHTKHRRTRSGCYTCRSRRVKCDEAHPICERCKKGGRECIYPETSTASKSGMSSRSAQSAAHESPGSSSGESDDDVGGERSTLEAIVDEDEMPGDHTAQEAKSFLGYHNSHAGQSLSSQKVTGRQNSETPSLVQDKDASPTPSTEGSVGYMAYQTTGSSRAKKAKPTSPGHETLRSDWSHLPPDLQFYLTYFYKNITYLHYSLKADSSNFLKTLYIDAALRNEALLHAVVGFSAFQRTLHNPDGKIQDFLQYYNKAVSLLLKSLKKGERHSTGTILAILQLATIEEFLGDWINLLGHQKAALQILTELYTPETVMESETTRVILGWYMRFDVFAGLLGGFEAVLPREWFFFAHEFYQRQIIKEPTILNWKIEAAVSALRLIAMDMSIVFARIGKGEITFEQFLSENENVGKRIDAWKTDMDPALQDERFLVHDFSGAPPVDPSDIVDPYIPGKIYSGPLWPMNVSTIDWHSVGLMHQYQTALTMKSQPSPELGAKAFESCQLFESVEFFPGSPPGTILALQASLGIAALFLPRDEAHAMWARRKLATIESQGYIYPYTFRTKMSDLFLDRTCMRWWLPNDEGYPPIIRSIRKFVEERTSPATDLPGEDLRDMKAIFASLNLGDGQPSSATALGKDNEVSRFALTGDHEVAETGLTSLEDYSSGLDDPYGFDTSQGYWDSQRGSSS